MMAQDTPGLYYHSLDDILYCTYAAHNTTTQYPNDPSSISATKPITIAVKEQDYQAL